MNMLNVDDEKAFDLTCCFSTDMLLPLTSCLFFEFYFVSTPTKTTQIVSLEFNRTHLASFHYI